MVARLRKKIQQWHYFRINHRMRFSLCSSIITFISQTHKPVNVLPNLLRKMITIPWLSGLHSCWCKNTFSSINL